MASPESDFNVHQQALACLLAHQRSYRHGVVGIDFITGHGAVALFVAFAVAPLLTALFITQQQSLLLRIALVLEVNGAFA